MTKGKNGGPWPNNAMPGVFNRFCTPESTVLLRAKRFTSLDCILNGAPSKDYPICIIWFAHQCSCLKSELQKDCEVFLSALLINITQRVACVGTRFLYDEDACRQGCNNCAEALAAPKQQVIDKSKNGEISNSTGWILI